MKVPEHATTPLVSIITTTYNHEAYIGACIESVLSQTYGNWEQIVLDDGSADNTVEAARRYKDSRVHVHTQPNEGIENLAHSYNKALSLARGSVIAILEGDDTWPDNKLEIMVPALQKSADVVLAFGEVQDIDSAGQHGTAVPRTNERRAKLDPKILSNDPVGSTTAFLLTTEGQSLIPPSSVIIRRSALEVIGGFQYFPGKCPTDVPTFVKLSRVGRFLYLPLVLGNRRRHLHSATLQYVDVMPQAARQFVDSAVEELGPELSDLDRRTIRRSWLHLMPGLAFTRGRISLINHNWRDARAQFVRAISSQDLRLKLAAATGIIGSVLHFDLEFFFRMTGRSTLRTDSPSCRSAPLT
jgi:glycosyltransferase involved in cell wall biosynthesis